MCDRPASSSPLERRRRIEEWSRTWSDRTLLVAVAAVLGFFVWNFLQHGTAVRYDPNFQAWTRGLFLFLGIALGFNLFLEVTSTWQELLQRKELPPEGRARAVLERSFQTTGGIQPLIRHCTVQVDRHFRRFYAFHRYQAPVIAYFYYAKTGSLALLSGPSVKIGLLLFFLVGYTSAARGDLSGLQGWETALLEAGCLVVLFGLFIRAAVPYRKVWIRIVEEDNRVCLTMTCSGRSRDRWFEAFCRSLEPQSGLVSASTHSR